MLKGRVKQYLKRNQYPILWKNNGKKYVVDSYISGGEIVSRKFTQLTEVQEKTTLSYLSEFTKKYCQYKNWKLKDSIKFRKGMKLKALDGLQKPTSAFFYLRIYNFKDSSFLIVSTEN